MSLFSDISTDDFLHHYWQKKPLYVHQSCTDMMGLTDGDELAGLACEDEVESRLISGHALHGDWQCQPGPFSGDEFAKLGPRNWTLLVQSVDLWDDDVADVLERFSFLPRWRLEDIMLSYAPVGGGVGPHFDYYDVFLIQVAGVREWRLGQSCNEKTPLQDNSQVKLLNEFELMETYKAAAGDLLYIPAGTAHWGVATSDDCITMSVGFRAPSESEVLIEAIEILTRRIPENRRYQDTPDSIDSNSYKINRPAQNVLADWVKNIEPQAWEDALCQAFGQQVTETRHPGPDDHRQDWTENEIEQLLVTNKKLRINHYPHVRVAFADAYLFVNGVAYSADERFARMISEKLIETPLTREQTVIVTELLNQGCIHWCSQSPDTS